MKYAVNTEFFMFPVLFKIGFFELRVYSLMYILALVIGMFMAKRRAHLLGLKPETVENAAIICFLSGILGARMYYVALRWDYYGGNFMEMVAVWHGGLAIHGGIIGAVLGLYFYTSYKKIKMLSLAELLVPWLLFGQGLGRIGNLANGEAHGVPVITPPSVIFSVKNGFMGFWNSTLSQAGLVNTPESVSMLGEKIPFNVQYAGRLYAIKEYVPWGMSFGNYKSTAAYADFGSLAVHPTFLYEMILNFLFFIPLYLLWKNPENIGKGRIIGFYLVFYALIRAFVTFFRADDLMVGVLRAPHLVSIIMIAIGLFLVFRNGRYRKKS